MRKPWPRAWKNTAHQDRLDENGRIVTQVTLRNASGEDVVAGTGDMVRLRKNFATVGVIDRITPSRVRVITGNTIGNYLEENLIFYRRGARNDIVEEKNEGQRQTNSSTSVVTPQISEPSDVKEEAAQQESMANNDEVIAFFKEMETKMLQYTSAAVELFVMMEKAKAKFTHGHYPDNTKEIHREFMNEAMRRLHEFQQFIDSMESKLKNSRQSER